MKFVITPRKAGKTLRLVEWVKQGEPVKGYPFWSRIILVHSLQEADQLRKPGNRYGLEYRQVFSVNEWQKARYGASHIEVGIDNLDMIMASALNIHNISIASATGTVLPRPVPGAKYISYVPEKWRYPVWLRLRAWASRRE